MTLIGDSQATAVLYNAEALKLASTGVDLRFETAVCRRLVQESCPYNGERPPTALELIDTKGSRLGETVILSVGYNDYVSEFDRNVDLVMKALLAAGVRRVFWLTLVEQRDDWKQMNKILLESAKTWPQLTVLDWNANSRDQPWFVGSDIHLNQTGAVALGRYLHQVLLDADLVAAPAPLRFKLTVVGKGRIVRGTTACARVCAFSILPGGTLKLVARPATGFVFAGWRGRCSGLRAACTLTPTGDGSAIARFRARAPAG